MPDLFDNPLGLDGFEFLEFSAPEKGILEPGFERMGFSMVARHRSKDVQLWRQGGINLIANYEPKSPAAYFAAEHGPSACGMGFRVKDAAHAYQAALDRGAEPVEVHTGVMELNIPAIRGIGHSLIYLIDRYDGDLTIYDIDFIYEDGAERNPPGAGFKMIDHLTHNVYNGRIAHWEDFYSRIFGFREFRQFDVTGEYSGLNTKVMMAPDGKIRIPLNEEGGADGKGQIAEYLRAYNGEGIQHIAFASDDLYSSLDSLRQKGLEFAPPPPDTYYEMLEERLPGHGEPIEKLKERAILVDGSVENGEPHLLMQIFSQLMVGPVFFEFIQRKGDEGFGEGNISALFKSMEEDQIRRGVLQGNDVPG
ncbi:4-hydroxyphenylpyruvate dioxygenase [Altererythrobacter atlanticus]|uniref:4-hydroxyphenylpyruvate dioxygenase n=1 Tax=Croceibacterium atlanticum TaxID=1267766 RepID=A0A0F7KQS4_9SPHN|nr:4-hydroxyphenylpyruvate dioxygenase [Croceibacterium atlanticum]AKH41527.1 4-hydroxyphenylpyruvate dioxygenase [Croceibacterium atlanticum]MBB5732989.1 4-hydroxyphenylpyruvate dioxygenase [Croceibacterium atlanticum]